MNTLRVGNRIFTAEYILYVDNIKVVRPGFDDVFGRPSRGMCETSVLTYNHLLFGKNMHHHSLYVYFDIHLVGKKKVTKYINFSMLPDNIHTEAIREKYAEINSRFDIDKIQELEQDLKVLRENKDSDFQHRLDKQDQIKKIYKNIGAGDYFKAIKSELVPDIVKQLKRFAERKRDTIEFEINKVKSPRVI